MSKFTNYTLFALLLASIQPVLASESASPPYLVPKLVAQTPMNTVNYISDFFSKAENKVKIQFPSNETRYVWQNMSRFYTTAPILCDGQIKPLPRSIKPTIGDVSAQINGKTLTLNQHLDQYPVDAFMVVQRGKVVFERYNTMRAIDKHNWFSSGKVIGATLLAMLEAEGQVELSRPVSFYLEELKDSVWDTVTVQQTVDMATGLNSTEHDEPNHDSRTNPDQAWYKWAASLGLAPGGGDATPLEVLRTMQRKQPGNQSFEYNSMNTFVINRIVEQITSLSLNEYFSQRIWRKMGAQADGYVATSPQGYALHFFSTNSNLQDMARFGMAFTPSGGYLVPKKVVTKMQTAGKPEIFAQAYLGKLMNESFPAEKLRNAYQWDAIFEDGDMFKGGVGGQGLYVSPVRDTVIVWFSTGTGKNKEETFAREIAKYLKPKV